MRIQKESQKSQIYFSRTYRHLKPDSRVRILFLLGCVLPSVVLFLLFYTKISYLLAVWVERALLAVIPGSSLGIGSGDFLPFFGGIYYVQIPSTMPSFRELEINLVITLLLLFICLHFTKNNKGGKPLPIYFAIFLLIHLIAIIYFMFAKDFYPYSATQYSELYIKQQVSIWLSFLVITGLITGILGYGSIPGRLITFVGTMAYSFISGCVRCLTFMFIVSRFSSLYMALLFFSLGPLFDFLYLVCFYSIYINEQIKHFDQGEGRLRWYWL